MMSDLSSCKDLVKKLASLGPDFVVNETNARRCDFHEWVLKRIQAYQSRQNDDKVEVTVFDHIGHIKIGNRNMYVVSSQQIIDIASPYEQDTDRLFFIGQKNEMTEGFVVPHIEQVQVKATSVDLFEKLKSYHGDNIGAVISQIGWMNLCCKSYESLDTISVKKPVSFICGVNNCGKSHMAEQLQCLLPMKKQGDNLVKSSASTKSVAMLKVALLESRHPEFQDPVRFEDLKSISGLVDQVHEGKMFKTLLDSKKKVEQEDRVKSSICFVLPGDYGIVDLKTNTAITKSNWSISQKTLDYEKDKQDAIHIDILANAKKYSSLFRVFLIPFTDEFVEKSKQCRKKLEEIMGEDLPMNLKSSRILDICPNIAASFYEWMSNLEWDSQEKDKYLEDLIEYQACQTLPEVISALKDLELPGKRKKKMPLTEKEINDAIIKELEGMNVSDLCNCVSFQKQEHLAFSLMLLKKCDLKWQDVCQFWSGCARKEAFFWNINETSMTKIKRHAIGVVCQLANVPECIKSEVFKSCNLIDTSLVVNDENVMKTMKKFLQNFKEIKHKEEGESSNDYNADNNNAVEQVEKTHDLNPNVDQGSNAQVSGDQQKDMNKSKDPSSTEKPSEKKGDDEQPKKRRGRPPKNKN